MKKITRRSLNELAEVMPVLDEKEMCGMVGGFAVLEGNITSGTAGWWLSSGGFTPEFITNILSSLDSSGTFIPSPTNPPNDYPPIDIRGTYPVISYNSGTSDWNITLPSGNSLALDWLNSLEYHMDPALDPTQLLNTTYCPTYQGQHFTLNSKIAQYGNNKFVISADISVPMSLGWGLNSEAIKAVNVYICDDPSGEGEVMLQSALTIGTVETGYETRYYDKTISLGGSSSRFYIRTEEVSVNGLVNQGTYSELVNQNFYV